MDSIQKFQSVVLNLENKERMQDQEIERNCHDLAKRLSYYLYFFSFSFSFGLTTHKKCRKVLCHRCHSHMK